MRSAGLCLTALALSALVPLLPHDSAPTHATSAEPNWTESFEGRRLTRLPLSQREQRFHRNFPGRVARFTDGERELVVRWVAEETRRLHPAADCLRGAGYTVTPLPQHVDDEGNAWSCVEAVRKGERLCVRERVHDLDGGSWADVSAWYWAARLGNTQGPWWAVTVAEPLP